MDNLPESKNFVDEHVFANLKQIGIPPSPVCDDATFLRRVSLDIAGRLPTQAETAAFLASTDTDKRDRAIEVLLRNAHLGLVLKASLFPSSDTQHLELADGVLFTLLVYGGIGLAIAVSEIYGKHKKLGPIFGRLRKGEPA